MVIRSRHGSDDVGAPPCRRFRRALTRSTGEQSRRQQREMPSEGLVAVLASERASMPAIVMVVILVIVLIYLTTGGASD